jgi:hypothetical protein
MNRLATRVLFAVSSLVLATSSQAITHTWNGGNTFGPDSMANSLNWSGGAPVSSSAALTLIFPGSPSSNSPNQNIASPLVLQSLSITGSFYTFSGNGLQFTNLGANPTISTTVGTNSTFNVPMTFSAPTTVNNNAFSTWNGLLAGSAPLTINATQQLNIGGSGPTSYTGLLTLNSGSLVLQRNGTVTNGDVNAAGGAIICNAPNLFGPNTDFSSTGGVLLLNTGNQTVRDLTIGNFGAISYASNNTLTVTGNVSTIAGASSIGSNSGDLLDLNGGATLFNIAVAGASHSMNVNASIINGSINKTGPGTLNIFSPTNTFIGTNVVSGGILRGTPSSIGTSVLNNATVALSGAGAINTAIISGSGDVIIESGSFFQLNAAQSYTGGTDLQGAILVATAATLSGDYTSTSGVNGGTVELQQAVNGTMGATFSGGVQLRKYGAGVLSIGGTNTQNGSVDLYQGGLNITSDAALGVGVFNLAFGSAVTVEATGNRSVGNPLFFGSGTTSIVGSGNFSFTDTGAKTLNSSLVHSSTGNTTIAGKFSTLASSSISVSAGSLTLGDSGVVGGFVAAGPINISGGVLTLNSLNFISLPDVNLAGGTLNAPSGYAIPLGAALQGSGGVTGRVASANGSTIIATGNLTMGDAAHPAGVNLDGELYTGSNTVTLSDSNQSVLGSYTRVGTTSANGTIVANKGLVVNFGRNIEGRGQVQSINSLANAVLINGDASGDSITNYLEFTGYVKGVGTFNNVAFSGTFSPGLSPALLTVGTVVLTPSNILEMELGGVNRGTQYDAFDINGTLVLDGQLKLTLINSFNPVLGNQFDLFNGTTTGAFSSFYFPPLSVGLVWDSATLIRRRRGRD